jgi:uncharacterized membrane protein YhaH (DUF805 family)
MGRFESWQLLSGPRKQASAVNVPDGQTAEVRGAPIRPSRRWYWVAGCLLAGGAVCLALAVAGLFSLNGQIRDFQRVRVPGQAEVSFAQPGGYVLYIERPGQCCSVATGTGNSAPFGAWSMRVALVPVAGGRPLSLTSWGSSTESYAVTGHQGQAALSVTIARPGRYVLDATNLSPPSITDIAVGRGIGQALLIPLLLGTVAVFVLFPAGLLVGGVIAYRRHRARRLPGQLAQPAVASWPAVSASGPAGAYPSQSAPYPPSSYPAPAAGYLEGGPVGFGDAIKQAFTNGLVYRGRASRSAYWWFVLFEVIVSVVLDLLVFSTASLKSGPVFPVVAISSIAALCLALIGLSLLVRRLHDSDKSGWWVLIGLVPFVGLIVLLVFSLAEGTPGPNRYQS